MIREDSIKLASSHSPLCKGAGIGHKGKKRLTLRKWGKVSSFHYLCSLPRESGYKSIEGDHPHQKIGEKLFPHQ